MTVLDDFLVAGAAEIGRRADLASTSRAELVSGAAAFRDALAGATPLECELSSVPVVDSLSSAAPGPLRDAAVQAASEIPWVASSRMSDGGSQAALGLIDSARDLGSLTCGLMLIGAGHSYPEHRHAPQELYLPLSGTGQWRFGGNDHYRALGDDELVYNHPSDLHGAHAEPTAPLLALYILWG